MTGGADAGVGDEKDSMKSKVAGELSNTRDRAWTEDDACPGLEIEGHHLK